MSSKHRGRWTTATVAMLLLVAACGDTAATTTTAQVTTTAAPAQTTTTAAATTTVAAEPFRIAIVAPSASNDLAFTQSIVDAVNRIQQEMGADVIEVAVTDGTFVVEDAAAAIRDYADQGYDLVIAHGSQYGGSLQEIAPDFPDTSFAWGTAADTFGLPNVYSYEAASDEGAYVMGLMAAALTESKVIGVVGPIEVGDAKLYVDGFKAGVTAGDPDVTANVNYTGSFSDVALAAEAGEAFVAAGADIMTGTAQMVVGAVGVASANGVLWFGTQSNQTSLDPELVVASQVYHWEVVLNQIIENIKGGAPGGEIFEINLANDGIVIEFNDGYALSADVRTVADDAIAGLKDGSMTTGF